MKIKGKLLHIENYNTAQKTYQVLVKENIVSFQIEKNKHNYFKRHGVQVGKEYVFNVSESVIQGIDI